MSALTTLSITASAGRARCALHDADHRLIGAQPEAGDLLPTVQRLCAQHGIAPGAIDRVRLDQGPGSYTGLRTSITFARSLAALRTHQPDLPPLTVETTTSFELMAACLTQSQTTLHILLDARRGRVHHGHLDVDARSVRLRTPPRAVPLADLATVLDRATGAPIRVSASCRGAVESRIGAAGIDTLDQDLDLLSAMADPRIGFAPVAPDQLEPLYLMGSYAGEAG